MFHMQYCSLELEILAILEIYYYGAEDAVCFKEILYTARR